MLCIPNFWTNCDEVVHHAIQTACNWTINLAMEIDFSNGEGQTMWRSPKRGQCYFSSFRSQTPPMFGWTKGRTDEQRKSGHVHNSFFCVCLFQYNLFLGVLNSPKCIIIHYTIIHNLKIDFKNHFTYSNWTGVFWWGVFFSKKATSQNMATDKWKFYRYTRFHGLVWNNSGYSVDWHDKGWSWHFQQAR